MRPNMRVFDLNQGSQFFRGNLIISVEGYAIHLVFASTIDLVQKNSLIRLLLKIGGNFRVVVALILEIVDEVLLALLY